ARRDHHWQLFANLPNGAGDVEARHAGHGQVGHDHVEVPWPIAQRLQRLLGIAEARDLVTRSLQYAGHQIDQRFFIVDVHHAAAAPSVLWFARLARRALLIDRRRVFGHWKVQSKRRALAGLARHDDRALVTAHDAVDDAQAQARATPDGLGREERIEYAIECGPVHATARVADRQAHVTPRFQRRRVHAARC